MLFLLGEDALVAAVGGARWRVGCEHLEGIELLGESICIGGNAPAEKNVRRIARQVIAVRCIKGGLLRTLRDRVLGRVAALCCELLSLIVTNFTNPIIIIRLGVTCTCTKSW